MDELKHAENLLEQFVMTFATLCYLTLNFHMLLHFPENVKQLDPTWGYSCFPFEDETILKFKRIKLYNKILHSKEYTTVKVRYSYTVPYIHQ